MIRLTRILLPTDFSEAAAPAAEYACSLAEKFRAELHVLHVVPETLPVVVPEYGATLWPENFIERAETAAREALETLPNGDWRDQLQIVRATRRGPAHSEIVRYAREHEVDLIVLGTHGRSGLMHFLLGSVAERVVRTSGCPVLTVRQDAQHEAKAP